MNLTGFTTEPKLCSNDWISQQSHTKYTKDHINLYFIIELNNYLQNEYCNQG